MHTSVDCSWASVWAQRCRASLAALSVSAALPSPSLTLSARLLKSASACSPTHTTCLAMMRYAADLLWSVMHSVLEMIRQCQWSTVACKVPKGPGRQTKLQGDIRRLYYLRERRGTSTAYTYTSHAPSWFMQGKQLGDILGEGTRGAAPDGRGVEPGEGHAAGQHLWPLPCHFAIQLACLPPPTCTCSLFQTCT